jgi:anti-sigma B factor antagonist
LSTEELTFETADRGETRVFRLTGKCTLYNTQPLKEAVDASLKERKKQIVFDLAGCEFMDSAGMGALVGCKFKCTKEGGRLAVCNVPPEVLATLRLARLDRLMDIADSLEKAIELVQSSSPPAVS